MRKIAIEKSFADIEDLSNEAIVKDRFKTVTESYAGLLASDAPSGAGSKSGEGATVTKTDFKNVNLAEVAKDPAAYVRQAIAAAEAE